MAIRDLQASSEQTTRRDTEFCVIGAGMAGLFLARRLARAGRRVTVLESGRDGFDERSHALNEIVDIHGRYRRALDGRYRGLGGSSSRWGGRVVPIDEHDIRPRPYLGLEGWPFPHAELAAYADEVEDVFGLPHDAFGADAIRRVHLDSAFPVDDAEFTGRLAKWINFRRCNLATVWRAELEAQDGIEIWLGATVTDFRLDTERGRLGEVEARDLSGKTIRVRAERFIIAAGTIESTRLLLWLDAQSNRRAFASTPTLGHYFQDHIKCEVATISREHQALSNRLFAYHYLDGTRRSLHLDLTTGAQEQDGGTSAFAYAAMDLSQSSLHLVKSVVRGLQSGHLRARDFTALLGEIPLMLRSAWWLYTKGQVFMPENVRLGVQIAIEQLPQWDNHIRLASERDALGMPKAELHWMPRAEDERTFQTTARRLRSYWRRIDLDDKCPLTWLAGEEHGLGRYVDRGDAYAHPSGSARMGTNPATSVVGPDLVCHAISNLSVASAAVFPSSGSANPTFTILQLALRHADMLLGKATGSVQAVPRQAGSASLTEAMAPLSASAMRTTSSTSI